MRAEVLPDSEEGAFQLKFMGRYEQALQAYAWEYARARQNEAPYIMDICLEHLFDCCLLMYLQQGKVFTGQKNLLSTIKEDLSGILRENAAFDEQHFKEQFPKLQRQLFPRGRGKNPFSVDPQLLIKQNEKLKRGRKTPVTGALDLDF